MHLRPLERNKTKYSVENRTFFEAFKKYLLFTKSICNIYKIILQSTEFPSDIFIHLLPVKKTMLGWRGASAFTALTEDPNSGSRTYIVAHKQQFSRSDALFSPLWTPGMHMYTHTHAVKTPAMPIIGVNLTTSGIN